MGELREKEWTRAYALLERAVEKGISESGEVSERGWSFETETDEEFGVRFAMCHLGVADFELDDFEGRKEASEAANRQFEWAEYVGKERFGTPDLTTEDVAAVGRNPAEAEDRLAHFLWWQCASRLVAWKRGDLCFWAGLHWWDGDAPFQLDMGVTEIPQPKPEK